MVNDWCAYTGEDTTSTEISVIESIFKLRGPSSLLLNQKSSMLLLLARYHKGLPTRPLNTTRHCTAS